MLSNLSNTLKKYANGWLVLVFFGITAYFQLVVFAAQGEKIKTTSGGTGPIDLLLFYTPEKVFGMIESYGAELRASYRIFELTSDIAFPIAYTLFFSLAITWLFQRGLASDSNLHKYNVVPFGAWITDLSENLGIVTMLSVFPATPVLLAWVTAIFTLLKWLFILPTTILLLYGLVRAALNKFQV